MRQRLWLVTLLSLWFVVVVAAFVRLPSVRAAPDATTITVNTTLDAVANDGKCSLREAIQSANTDAVSGASAGECPAGSGADKIIIPRLFYSLTIPAAGSNDNTTGDLNITSDVVLTTTPAPNPCFLCFPPIVQGGVGWADRILNITGTAHVTIYNLWLQNGNTFQPGGGIYHAGASFNADGLIVANNQSPMGAGIYAQGPMTLTNGTVFSNSATSSGGGIFVTAPAKIFGTLIARNYSANNGGGLEVDAPTTISNSTVQSNTAGNRAGGIYVTQPLSLTASRVVSNVAFYTGAIHNQGAGNPLVILNSQIISNTSMHATTNIEGGAIFNAGALLINNSDIALNFDGDSGGGLINSNTGQAVLFNTRVLTNTAYSLSNSDGGGILNRGAMTIVNSLLSGNHAKTNGGAIENSGTLTIDRASIEGNTSAYAGGLMNLGTTTVINSSVSNNIVSSDAGGIQTHGTLVLTNTTVGGNQANRDGGGIRVVSGVALLNNVTIALNTADADMVSGGAGGGLLRFGGAITLSNSILAFNADNLGGGPDCKGTITSLGYNLLLNALGCSPSPSPGLKLGFDPLLGPLADNGGGTLTYALLPGSPALDAGNPGAADGIGGHCAPTDQRGLPRPIRAVCDMGAFEAGAVLYLPLVKK